MGIEQIRNLSSGIGMSDSFMGKLAWGHVQKEIQCTGIEEFTLWSQHWFQFLIDFFFNYFQEEVMTLERILLQTIKFDLQVEHPYQYLLKYAKMLKTADTTQGGYCISTWLWGLCISHFPMGQSK